MQGADKGVGPKWLDKMKKELVDMYLQDIDKIALHMFQSDWNYEQFKNILEYLSDGNSLQVLDFANNWLNKFQDKHQSLFRLHLQMILHPIVNYYKCRK